MAFLYSQDASATAKGDLGYFRKGELIPILEQEALRLRVGEVSGIVRSTVGFHILKLLDRKEGVPIPFEEVKERIQAEHFAREMEKAIKRFVSSLREKSIIIIKL